MPIQAWIIVDDDPEFSEDKEARITLIEPGRWAGGTVIPIVYEPLETDKESFK